VTPSESALGVKFRTDYYEILGLTAKAGFHDVKRAYYRRAKECHPDRFAGSRTKEEEFKIVVEAFDVLSDPVRRREYDLTLPHIRVSTDASEVPPVTFTTEDPESIMDSIADDILEELIVGNTIPPGTTLQTLMQNLENTERFCLFREAKTLFHTGRSMLAFPLLVTVTGWSPENILYRYYLAQALIDQGKTRKAVRHLKTILAIGASRYPPQRLIRVRRLLHSLQKERRGILRYILPSSPPPAYDQLSPEDEMARQVGRLIDRAARKRAGKLSGHRSRRLLRG